MSETITIGMVRDQILGLQRTQAEECWIRKDVIFHILGDKANEFIAHSVSMNETPTKAKNLVQAMRQRKNHKSTNQTLVCIDRAPALEAMIQAVADMTAGKKTKISSPGKKPAGDES